jgi:hypothetical protein
MAGTTADNSIPAGDWWPLLSQLLDFVSECLRSEVAAKEFLLDYFDEHPIEWCYKCTSSPAQSTIPPELRAGMGPIPLPSQEAEPIYSFFWRDRKKRLCDCRQFDVDWQASSVSYDGPLIRTNYSDDRGGRHATPWFDGFWRVQIRVTLIRINAAPIVAELRSLELLPPAPVPARLATTEALDQARADGVVEAADQAKVDDAVPTEPTTTKAWCAREASIMKSRGQIPKSKRQFADQLATRLEEAARTDSRLRAVKPHHIETQLPDWGLWPIDEINEI